MPSPDIHALIVVTVMSIAAGLCSCWLIMVGWSLLGDAISHAILPGVVLAYALGIPLALGALITALIAVAIVNGVSRRTTLRQDTTIGIIFTAFFALGLVLISRTPGAEHLEEILFGNLIGISTTLTWHVVFFGTAAIIIVLKTRTALTLWAFDATHAANIGLNIPLIRGALLTALVFVVISASQAVGAILVVAMLVTPGATAYLLTRRLNIMLLLSPSIALCCSLLGLICSTALDVSPGGSIILIQFCVFLGVWLFAPREGILRSRRNVTALR